MGTPSNSYTMLYQWDGVGNPTQVSQEWYSTSGALYDSAAAYDSDSPYDSSPQYLSGQTDYAISDANELTQLQYNSGAPLSITSDADGNVTGDFIPTGQPGVYEARSYAWDDSDRMLSVTSGSSVETYLYGADGMRWQKSLGSGNTVFVRDGENVLQELSGSTPSAYYTQLPGEWGGLFSRRDLNLNQSSFYGFDPFGNARLLVTPGISSPDKYGYTGLGWS